MEGWLVTELCVLWKKQLQTCAETTAVSMALGMLGLTPRDLSSETIWKNGISLLRLL